MLFPFHLTTPPPFSRPICVLPGSPPGLSRSPHISVCTQPPLILVFFVLFLCTRFPFFFSSWFPLHSPSCLRPPSPFVFLFFSWSYSFNLLLRALPVLSFVPPFFYPSPLLWLPSRALLQLYLSQLIIFFWSVLDTRAYIEPSSFVIFSVALRMSARV